MDPAPETALTARLIQNHPDFEARKSIDIDASARDPCPAASAQRDSWRRLSSAGYIRLTSAHTGLPGCVAEITAEARRETTATVSSSSARLALPVADRNFVNIVEIRHTSGRTYEALFTWEWRPNAIGVALGSTAASQNGIATLRPSAEGWRILEIRFDE
jgi:hypothetical protein